MSGKYKVGDYVRIREDLKPMEKYGHVVFASSLKGFCGHIGRVDYVDTDGTYWLNISGYYYWWSDEMLEPVQISPDEKKDYQGKKKMPPSAEKLCKLIGALLYAGVEEFNISYSRGEISCSAGMDVSEVEDG